MNAETVVAAVLGSVLGGGAISGVLYLALRGKLIDDLVEIFAKRSELNGQGARLDNEIKNVSERLEQMRVVAMSANDLGAQNNDAIARIQEADRVNDRHLTDTLARIDRHLNEMDRRQREDRSMIDKTVGLLDTITKRMDRIAH